MEEEQYEDEEDITIDKSLYRVKGNNNLRVWGIFQESNSGYAVFWKGPDHKEVGDRTIYSFRKLFMEMGDPTGVLFALEYLDGINHWDRLARANEVQLISFMASCIDDVKRVMAANAIKDTIFAAEGGNQSAAKLLIGREYETLLKGKGKVGRPPKEEGGKQKFDDSFSDYDGIVGIMNELNQRDGETAQ